MSRYKIKGSYLRCPICGNKEFYDVSKTMKQLFKSTLVCTYCSYHMNFGIEFSKVIIVDV